MIKPTSNFKFEEFKVSADYPDLAKSIKLTELDKFKIYTLSNMLEHVRTSCGSRPIRILSGKRSATLNRAIRGYNSSDHLFYNNSAAADFDFFNDIDILWTAYKNLANIKLFGQLILYIGEHDNEFFPRFIHLSLPSPKHQEEKLIYYRGAFMYNEDACNIYPKLNLYINTD